MFDAAAESAALAELENAEQFRSLVSNIPGAVYRRHYPEPWTMSYISDHVEVLTGYPASDFTENERRSYESLICVEDRDHVSAVVREQLRREGSFAVEYRLADASGYYRWVAEHGRCVAGTDGHPQWIDGIIFDLSAHKEAEQHGAAQSRHRLGHDSLTCLPDRTLIRDRLQQILLRSQRDHDLVAAFLVDLDNFRSINEHLGQDAGDELLKAVANRLMGVLRACDTIGRPSGDEFAILADGLSLSGGPSFSRNGCSTR